MTEWGPLSGAVLTNSGESRPSAGGRPVLGELRSCPAMDRQAHS